MPLAFFRALKQSAAFLDKIQKIIAEVAQWLVLLMTLTIAAVVVGRFFNLGSTALQESISYMHGTLFMLCIAYTAYADGHVRVDINYRRLKRVNQAWINLIGTCVFLLPFALFLVLVTWQSAAQSWQIRESSNNAGGLPFVFLLKTLPPITGLLLCLHAVSDLFKQLSFVSLKEERVGAGP